MTRAMLIAGVAGIVIAGLGWVLNADQFYGGRGGRVKDPFDQEWMLSARLEKLTVAEIAARAPGHG